MGEKVGSNWDYKGSDMRYWGGRQLRQYEYSVFIKTSMDLASSTIIEFEGDLNAREVE